MSPFSRAVIDAGGRHRSGRADIGDDHLAAGEQARRAGVLNFVQHQFAAVGHGTADDHAVVVGVDELDGTGLKQAGHVEMGAQGLGIESAHARGIHGMADFDGGHC